MLVLVRRFALVTVAVLAIVAGGCGGDGAREGADDAVSTPAPSGMTTGDDAPVASDGTTSTAPATTGAAGDSSPPSTGTATPPPPLPGLPRWTAGYRSWARLNAEPLPERDPDPHRGTKNVFASRDAENGVFPPGTVIVKEAFRPGADFVGLVAAMRKEPGRNPQHNDWVFVEWTRDSRDSRFGELARGDVCTSCHVGASGSDYVFTRG